MPQGGNHRLMVRHFKAAEPWWGQTREGSIRQRLDTDEKGDKIESDCFGKDEMKQEPVIFHH